MCATRRCSRSPSPSNSPSDARDRADTRPGSRPTGAARGRRRPRTASAAAEAISSARRVFPIPPGPVIVSNRTSSRCRSAVASARLSSRPISVVIGAGRGHPAISSCRRSAIASANRGSLMLGVDLVHLDLRASTSSRSVEKSASSASASREHLALRRQQRDAAQRHVQDGRPGGGVQLARDRRPDLPALLRRRRVAARTLSCTYSGRPAKRAGKGSGGPMTTQSSAAERDDLGDAQAPGGLEPLRAGGQMPPPISSASSDVVTSSTPATSRSSPAPPASWPPRPTWWKTSTS